MSTQASGIKDVDDEPEEGEIQDDEGSLEDVSSDDEIYPYVKRKERAFYSRTFLPIRSQFAKTDAQLMQSTRRDRLGSSKRTDPKLKKGHIRLKSGCRVTGVQDNYHESMQGRRSSKDHSQKVSGKIHEKENKAKDSKKAHRKSMSYPSSGSELGSAYNFSEPSESYFPPSTSSKSSWQKSELKEKHKKKRKNSKSNKFCSPLGEVCASQLKIGNDSSSVDGVLKSDLITKGSAMSQKENEADKEKAELSPSSVASDIQILDVPIVFPEIITICDSDDDLMLKTEGGNNNLILKEDSNELQASEPEISLEKKDAGKNNAEDSEDNLKFLREAALKSSKPEACLNVNYDDDVLQLRLAALRSAIIRKCEERKKRGLTLSKTNRNVGNQQMMSISPLGSPNYCSSGDSSIRASDEVECDPSSPFDFNVSSNLQGVSVPLNESEVDKIATIDMELAESDEEKEQMCIDVREESFNRTAKEDTESSCINSCKVGSPLKPLSPEINNAQVMYPPVDSAGTQKSLPSGAFPLCASSEDLRPMDVVCGGAGHVLTSSSVAYNIHNIQHSLPGGHPLHASNDRADHAHVPYGGAGPIYPSVDGANLAHIPSSEVGYMHVPSGYIIGDEEYSVVFEPVLNNSGSTSQHQFFESKKNIVQHSNENENRIIEDTVFPGIEAHSNNSNCEQDCNPVHDNVEMIDDLSSQSFQPSESSITFNVGNETAMCNEISVGIYELGKSDCRSPENKELDLDSMIVLDETGESSDDGQSECSPERLSHVKESYNCSNEDFQSNTEHDDGAKILKCLITQNNSEVNMLSPRCNSINLIENKTIDLGNSVIGEGNETLFVKDFKRHAFDVKLEKFKGKIYAISDNILKLSSSAIKNSKDILSCEDIHKSREGEIPEVSDHALRIISTDSQDSSHKSSNVNVDESTSQGDEISDPALIMLEDSQVSSDKSLQINIHDSTSQEDKVSHAEKVISVAVQNSSGKSSFVHIDESSQEIGDEVSREDSQDSSDKCSHVNIDESSHHEGQVSNSAKKIISTDSRNSSDSSLYVNIAESTSLEGSQKCNNISICESSNLSDSQSTMEMRAIESSCDIVGNSKALDNLENMIKSSSEEIEISLVSVTDVEKPNGKSIVQQELLPTCEESPVYPDQNTEDVEEPREDDDDDDYFDENISSSVDRLQCKEPTFISKYTFDTKEVEIVSNRQDSVVQDDETQMLRESLLETLKLRSQENNVQEIDHHSTSQKSDNLDKSILSNSLQTNTSSENVISIGSCKSIDAVCDTVVKQISQSSCATAVPQNSIISLFPRQVQYLSHNLTVNKRGAKSNKLGVHESKVSGRFNINVPKLVIHLGEDSDSGEDNERETSNSDLVSNCIESDVSKELRDSLGSQSVPPDFERKLDLLLKRARLQQEVTGNDVKEILSQRGNLSESCQKKVVKLRSLNSKTGACKSSDNLSIRSGNSKISSSPNNKVTPLIAQGGSNVHGKNSSIRVQTKNKIVFSGSNAGVTKTSADRTAGDHKKNINDRIKNISSNNQASLSISSSSVVDIGLLPSSKQKEYIRLKRQLAQLARKEQGVKIKDGTLSDATRLSIKKSSVEGVKGVAGVGDRSSALKNWTGIGTDLSVFNRKFVRRGQGFPLVPRTDFGKSRRIVKSVPILGNVLPVLRNRLSATPSRIGNTSPERSANSRRVLWVPPKKIITNANGVRKVSTGIEVSSRNVNINSNESEKQKKIVGLPDNFSVESAKQLKEPLVQVKCGGTKEKYREVQVNDSLFVNNNGTQKKGCGKTVLKRKGANSEHCETVFQKRIAVEQFAQGQTIDEQQVPTDLENRRQHQVGECCLLINSGMQEMFVETNQRSVKRKRTLSEDGRTMRWEPIFLETNEPKSTCTEESKSQNLKKTEVLDAKIVENLLNSESKLISKRYQVLQDIAAVQMNLHKIEAVKERKLQLIRNLERLKEETKQAVTQLNKEDELLRVFYTEVEIAKRGIMRRQSETLLLSVECEEMGCKAHGSSYCVPIVCTDLIRNGMATISKTLQDLKDEKTVELDAASNSCSSGEILPKETGTANELLENLESQDSEDSSKQTPGSYLSPLEAIRTRVVPNNDNQAVLCPYQIMGSCKDRECCYRH